MKRLLAQLVVALATFVGAASTDAQPAVHTSGADIILVNGEVLTMDPAKPMAQALAIRGDKLVAVGSVKDVRRWRTSRTQVIDLRGKTVVPGLIDSHAHAIRGGQSYTFESYWYDQTTLKAAITQLKDEATRRGAGKWLAVMGAWHPEQFAERRAPTSRELSEALPTNPVYIQYLYDFAIVNDKGIEALGLDAGTAMPPGIRVERDPQGKATGKLFGGVGPFNAMFSRIGVRTSAENRDSLHAFFMELNRHGVTGIVDAAAGDHGAYTPLFALWRDNALTLRVAYRASAVVAERESAWFNTALTFLPPLFGDDMLKFLGVGEALVVGMNDGVRMGAGFSPSQTSREELVKIALLVAERGYPLEAHAYTDDAAKALLDAFEKVAQVRPIKDLRWTITHISTGSEETFERMRKLGISYTVQMGPYFEAPAIREANSDDIAQASPPTRIALRKGMMVAGGTDSTRIGVINIWRAIEYHVTGRSVGGAVQRRQDFLLSREEALRLYTASAAWVIFDETKRGTLAPGKLADLAVLDSPYMRVPQDHIHRIRSVMTVVGGKVVHLQQDGLNSAVPSNSVRQSNRIRALQALASMHRDEEHEETNE